MRADHVSNWERLGEVVAEIMEKTQVPGVAVGILYQGEVSAAGFGVTNADHPLSVDDETLFQIGSITKTFTGTAIMRLVEEGKLDLDATLRTYVPDFRVADEEASAGVTVRHLLTHTAGWAGDFFHATGSGDDALARYVADMSDLPQEAPLGTHWSYNNAGFSLAGYLIERVSGGTFEAALQGLVLEPLGLKHTFMEPTDVMTHRFAVGHNVVEGKPRVARPWPLERSANPAGGLACSARDLLRYARFHLGDGRTEDGTQVLSAESIARMQEAQVTIWGDEAWGLTWALDRADGLCEIGHGGGTNGQVSQLLLIPERDFALVVLTNANRGGEVTRELRRWFLRKYLGLEVEEPEPLEAAEEMLAEYVGCYPGFFSDLELGMLGGKLVGQVTYNRSFPNEEVPPSPAPPPMTVDLCEEDRLLVLNGRLKDAKFDVVRRTDGSIGWLRVGGRLHRRQL